MHRTMRQSFILATSWASFAAAHGHLKEWIIDGTTYPAFDPLYDNGPTFTNIKRIEYGIPKLKFDIGPGVNPVDDVRNLSITCRWRPLVEPQLTAVARAGSDITFKWTDWFTSHKGPLITYMGLLPDSGKPEDVDFFKIDELAYDPKTRTWGSDTMMKNDHYHTATIPSDIKPGTYIVRHEIISLHNALNDDYVKRISGAQFYPQCAKVKVTGDGTATPSGGKFPGTYKWDDKGILINMFYMPNEYISPGGPVYKPAVKTPPKGPKPVVQETGALTGEMAIKYQQERNKTTEKWEVGVHNNDKIHPGGGGCIWEVGASPKSAKCSSTDTAQPELYAGYAQPPGSPDYIDQAHSDRTITKYGMKIKYLFDPTQPRWEERERAQTAGKVPTVLKV